MKYYFWKSNTTRGWKQFRFESGREIPPKLIGQYVWEKTYTRGPLWYLHHRIPKGAKKIKATRELIETSANSNAAAWMRALKYCSDFG